MLHKSQITQATNLQAWCMISQPQPNLSASSSSYCRQCHTFTPKRSISLMVMATYGCETSSSVIWMWTPSLPVARGAAIRSAVRYWLLTLPLNCTCKQPASQSSTVFSGQHSAKITVRPNITVKLALRFQVSSVAILCTTDLVLCRETVCSGVKLVAS